MPIPDPNFFASVPLQYVFRDKDTGLPLSAGVVSFFSDPDFTIPKSVYQLSLLPDNTIVFVDIGNVLILSSIGTFVDDSGDNLVPYYYPWTNGPEDTDPGDEELYFVKVYSSGGVLQFTLQEWPPNVGGGGSGTSGDVLSFNLITNPQFTVVSYIPNPTTGIYSYTTTGTMTVDIAPGWAIKTVGIGTIALKQQSLSDDIVSEPPYALQITSVNTSTLTSVQLIQRLTNSPRILASPEDAGLAAISGYLVAASGVSSSVAISMQYIPSDTSASEVELFSDSTDATGSYTAMTGSAEIATPISTADGSGYVDIVIDIGVGSIVKISSVQLVQVATTSVTPAFEQQSTQQQLNGMMWYYEPQLAYKPIPSYTVGWDFAFNPCQQLGPNVPVSGLGANTSRYIGDQVIAFESVANVLSYSFSNGGLAAITGTGTQLALIQYLPTNIAYELIHAPNLSSMIKGSFGADGYVSMYWTTGSASGLTTAFSGTGTNQTSGTSLVTALTDGIPTIAAGWNVIENPLASAVSSTSNLAAFSGDITDAQPLTGWVAPAASSDVEMVTYFAIVVSFKSIPTGSHNINFITLNAGKIPTYPAPLMSSQTLQALQTYYQMSFTPGTRPAYNVGTSKGEETFVQTGTNPNSTIMPINFYTPFTNIPAIAFYNPAANNGSMYNESLSATMGTTTSAFIDIRKCVCSAVAGIGSVGNVLMINWTADARPGTY